MLSHLVVVRKLPRPKQRVLSVRVSSPHFNFVCSSDNISKLYSSETWPSNSKKLEVTLISSETDIKDKNGTSDKLKTVLRVMTVENSGRKADRRNPPASGGGPALRTVS